MNCRIAHNLMQLELDGELAAIQREALHGHCGQCAACGAEREQLLAIQGAMRGLAAMTAPEETAALRFSPAAATTCRWWLAPAAAAAVIALMFGGYLLSTALRPAHVSSPFAGTSHPAPSIARNAAHLPGEEPSLAPRAGTEDCAEIRRASVEINNANVITVPHRTKNPNVTIIWVYPKVELATSADESNRQPS